MIRLTDIHKTYAIGEVAVHALQGVSLAVEPGEFVAIMGPSGSGKSTLLHILGLLDVPDAGSYRLLGREVARLGDNDLAALRNDALGFVFQHFNLLARTTALENTLLPLLYSPDRGASREDRARRLLAEVGLGDRLRHRPNELSGGQQQRVAIARALIREPRLLLADEPTGNLDSRAAEDILAILDGLNRRGITILMVTHEPDVAARARRILRMRDGRVQSDERTPGGAVPGASGQPTRDYGSPGGLAPPARSAGGATPPAEPPAAPRARGRRSVIRELPHDFRQAWRALMANKVRTVLSMLGILIGVTAVIAMLAIGAGARKAIEAQLSSMGSNMLVLRPGARRMGGVALEAGAVTRFTPQDVAAIRAAIRNVARAGGVVNGRGQVVYGNRNWNTRIQGVEPHHALMRAAQPIAGRFFTAQETAQRARVAVVGMTVVRQLFGDANPLGEFVKINKMSFQVIGVLPEKGSAGWFDQDDIVLVPLPTAMFRLLGREFLDSVDIEVASAGAMADVQEAVRALIVRTRRLPPSQAESFEVQNMAEMQAAFTQTSRTMAALLAAIAAVSLLVGGIGIMNIMLVSVTERTREIGVRKAVGARRRDILAQFLTEALVVSVLGGGLGIALGWGISLLVSRLAGWTTLVTASSVLLAVGFSGLVGMAFGLWPAFKAARLNPIDALRYE